MRPDARGTAAPRALCRVRKVRLGRTSPSLSVQAAGGGSEASLPFGSRPPSARRGFDNLDTESAPTSGRVAVHRYGRARTSSERRRPFGRKRSHDRQAPSRSAMAPGRPTVLTHASVKPLPYCRDWAQRFPARHYRRAAATRGSGRDQCTRSRGGHRCIRGPVTFRCPFTEGSWLAPSAARGSDCRYK